MMSGISARYLFVPLAEAVVFAMLASYVLSRTLVPTLAMYLLQARSHEPSQKNIFARLQHRFEKGFESIRNAYSGLLNSLVAHRKLFIPAFLAACLCGVFLVPWLGQDFFPDTDSGQLILHVRARTGTRIEETARLFDLVEDVIRQNIPAKEIDNILDNIGLPYSPYNTMHSTSGVLGANDGDVLVSFLKNHRPVAAYVRDLRALLPQQFPGVTFYFLPADIVTQILDFGLPSPIDVQVEGNDVVATQQIAENLMAQMRQIPGLVDLRVQQPFDYPTLAVAVDRVKALQAGYTEQNVANSVLNALSGSFQITPLFFMNWKNGVNYNLVAQTPQYRFQSINDLLNIPLPAASGSNTEILGDVATVSRGHEIGLITHYNIRRVIDIYGAVQDRDLGAVSRDVQKLVDKSRQQIPRGTFLTIRGQVRTMESSYAGLLTGLALAVVLVYMLIVINFQSWLDPFIIITALPAALSGIVLFLFFTHTTLSVPALMGALMCMGIATANSILVVSFAKERLREHGDSVRASIESGTTRFRPVVMTALAMIIGMIPMALGLGDGGEQNAPLGRAVIGGLLAATVATLVFVPAVFSMLHQRTSTIRAGEAEQQVRQPTAEKEE
jgi:multidrug efflux pump subunit AcrB